MHSVEIVPLAAIKNIARGLLLRRVHAQAVVVLHLNVCADIFALVRSAWREPLGQILVALGLVDVVGDGEQLWARHATSFVSLRTIKTRQR